MAGTEAPKIQRLITSCFFATQILLHYFEETTRKKKHREKAAGYAELLAKRMKETKVKYQEQSAQRCGLFSLKATISKSDCNQMRVLKSNK